MIDPVLGRTKEYPAANEWPAAMWLAHTVESGYTGPHLLQDRAQGNNTQEAKTQSAGSEALRQHTDRGHR